MLLLVLGVRDTWLTGCPESGGKPQSGRGNADSNELGAQSRNHRTDIGAEVTQWHPQCDAGRRAAVCEYLAQPRVGGHPAAEKQASQPVFGARTYGLGSDHVHDFLLETDRDVRHGDLVSALLVLLYAAGHCGLES